MKDIWEFRETPPSLQLAEARAILTLIFLTPSTPQLLRTPEVGTRSSRLVVEEEWVWALQVLQPPFHLTRNHSQMVEGLCISRTLVRLHLTPPYHPRYQRSHSKQCLPLEATPRHIELSREVREDHPLFILLLSHLRLHQHLQQQQ
jgi:hypothetical protein